MPSVRSRTSFAALASLLVAGACSHAPPRGSIDPVEEGRPSLTDVRIDQRHRIAFALPESAYVAVVDVPLGHHAQLLWPPPDEARTARLGPGEHRLSDLPLAPPEVSGPSRPGFDGPPGHATAVHLCPDYVPGRMIPLPSLPGDEVHYVPEPRRYCEQPLQQSPSYRRIGGPLERYTVILTSARPFDAEFAAIALRNLSLTGGLEHPVATAAALAANGLAPGEWSAVAIRR